MKYPELEMILRQIDRELEMAVQQGRPEELLAAMRTERELVVEVIADTRDNPPSKLDLYLIHILRRMGQRILYLEERR